MPQRTNVVVLVVFLVVKCDVKAKDVFVLVPVPVTVVNFQIGRFTVPVVG